MIKNSYKAKKLLIPFYAGLSVLFFYFALPGNDYSIFAWFALTPIILTLEKDLISKKLLVMSLSIASLTIWLLLFNWLAPSMVFYMGMNPILAWVLLILFCIIQSIPYILCSFLYIRYGDPYRPIEPFRYALYLTVFILWIPTVFPSNQAHLLYRQTKMIQIAEIGGIPILLFLVNLVNFLLAQFIIKSKEKRTNAFQPLIFVFIILGSLYLYGSWRIASYNKNLINSDSVKIKIGTLQPNINLPNEKHNKITSELFTDKNPFVRILNMTEKLIKENSDIDVIAWPENPLGMSMENSSSQKLATLYSIRFQKPIIFYTYQTAPKELWFNNLPRKYSTAELLNTSGNIVAFYKKRMLMPLGEYIPFEKEFPILRKIFPKSGKYIQGNETVLFNLKNGRNVIPLICYETVYPRMTREAALKGGNVILDMTNDLSFGRSNGPWIHLAGVLFRTVEHRLPMYRVANTGISAAIKATGEIVQGSESEIFEQSYGAYSMNTPKERTFYTNYGWYLPEVFLVLAILDFIYLATQYKRQMRVS